MSDASQRPAREAPTRRSFPYLTGISAQRLVELLTLRVAPAAAASAIAYTHLESEWQGLLVLVAMLGTATLLRRPQYPLHLIPFASATLYVLAPPLGATVAVAISAGDGYSVSHVTFADMVSPVLGAWLVTLLGAWVTHNFRRDREVRVAVIGSREFTRGLEAELEAVKVRGYRVLGNIEPERPCGDAVEGAPKCLGTLGDLRNTVLDHGVELLVLGPLTPASVEPAEGRFQSSGVSRL
jgi:hypothetical protein